MKFLGLGDSVRFFVVASLNNTSFLIDLDNDLFLSYKDRHFKQALIEKERLESMIGM